MQRRQLSHLALLAAAALAAPLALAQDKPAIRILVGFPPGGSVDIVARLLADKMRISLGQNVIVDNKPGAGGRIALGELRRAAADGQTLVLSPSGALVIQPWLYKNLGYDPVKDFSPVALVSTFDFALTTGPGAPAGDATQLVAQVINALVCIVFVFSFSMLFFKISNIFVPIRSKREDEIEGLDVPEMGVEAYPDFPTTDKTSPAVN